MHIRWLEDFVCLAQAGSLARAAELRNVTPPAFGRRMQALEVWAGAPLIDRSVFPVRLTAEGRQFLEAAQSALRTLDETRLALRAAPMPAPSPSPPARRWRVRWCRPGWRGCARR